MLRFFTLLLINISLNQAQWWYPWESCTEDWVNFDDSALLTDLQKDVFGQDLVIDIVMAALKGHFDHPSKKALVLSFHGPPGTGKNFVANKIVKSIYKENMKSSFVKLFHKSRDFAHDTPAKIIEYKDKIQAAIEKTTASCERSLFIFDEVHLMKNELMNALKSYIDYNPLVGNVDYRKTIFIFLSNSGSKEVNKLAIKYYTDGLDRNAIPLDEIQDGVLRTIYNEESSGFWNCELLRAHLISQTIPFLPLEIAHVRECIERDALSKGLRFNFDVVNEVLKYLTLFPKNSPLFVQEGCKVVEAKVDLVRRKFSRQGHSEF